PELQSKSGDEEEHHGDSQNPPQPPRDGKRQRAGGRVDEDHGQQEEPDQDDAEHIYVLDPYGEMDAAGREEQGVDDGETAKEEHQSPMPAKIRQQDEQVSQP